MKRLAVITLSLIALLWSIPKLFAQANFTGPELLGRPTDHSITVNVVADADLEAYFEYDTETGGGSDGYGFQTAVTSATANVPIEAVMSGLAADTRYYYRMMYREIGKTSWIAREEHSFQTQRAAGSTFIFTIASDSHLSQYGGQTADEKTLYTQTLQNAGNDNPDFHIDLGDTFAMDPQPLGSGMTVAEADAAYFVQRPYLGQINHSIPFFFALGNHENEEGWNFDDVFMPPDQSLAIAGIEARKKYFPNPIPDDFYSGNEDPLPQAIGGDTYREDYFAWEWGDALFVVIDPYHYSMKWPSEGNEYGGEGMDGEAEGDRWDWTLGIKQYLWLKSTLENSNAAFKFVFSHQVTGGSSPYGRGGVKAAPYFEWGGKNADGTWGFDTQRPVADGWDLPIHRLMVANGVSFFFHGHDHIYAYEMLDGIAYLECPKPDDAGYYWQPYGYGYIEGHYPDAIQIPNSGHIRVTVSPDGVKSEYIRSYLPGDGNNGAVAHSFTVPSPYTGLKYALTMAVDPAGAGRTIPAPGRHTYAENRSITIKAAPAKGYLFDHWTGDVADLNAATTTVTMDADQKVAAHFVLAPTYTLNMGTNSFRGGTTNPALGNHGFTENSVVSITALPASGYAFDHWIGDVADVESASTTLTMDGDKAVTAHFAVTPPGALVYMGAIGTATSKTSGTSLVIQTRAAVAPGDAIVIAFASDPYQDLTVQVADAAGNTYHEAAIAVCYQHVRNYIFAAYDVRALPIGSPVTITISNAVTARAAVASAFRGLTPFYTLDQSLGNPVSESNASRSGTTPIVGPTGTTMQANELLIGSIATEGPVEDVPGTWDYSFIAGPRAGTTGGIAATNLTISMGYRIVSAIGRFTAQKSGTVDRYWGSALATFKAGRIRGTNRPRNRIRPLQR